MVRLVFATIPSLKARIASRGAASNFYQFIVVDLTNVHRLETSAAEVLGREAGKDVGTRALVFCGVSPDAAICADLRRGGLQMNFGAQNVQRFCVEMLEKGSLAFESRADAVKWCKCQLDRDLPTQHANMKKPSEDECKPYLIASNEHS